MGRRNWAPLLFAALAVLLGLWAVLRSFSPFYRLRSKVGSWEGAWEIVAQNPGYWAGAVAARMLVGALLIWFALRWRQRGLMTGYAGLAIAAAAIHIAELGLWLFARLG